MRVDRSSDPNDSRQPRHFKRRRQFGVDLGPRSVRESIEAVVGKLDGAPSADLMAGIVSTWDDVVGPNLIGHTQPIALKDSVLVVLVDHQSVGTALRVSSASIIRVLENVLGSAPERIEIKIGRM